jgi:MFS family permease
VAVIDKTEDLAEAPARRADAASTGFASYLFAHGAWFLAFGVQAVLFPYLVRVVLHENEIRFGFAQMSLQLPTTLLILIGGFVADRVDTRRMVVLAFVAAVATFLALGVMVALGRLTYGLLIAYALVVGIIGAFAGPARDSLLSQMAPEPGGIQKAVAFASMAQFGGQILGMVLAALAPLLGVVSLLLGQAGLMAAAAIAALRMRPRPASERRQREGNLPRFISSEIGGGFSAVVASPVIAPVLMCSIGMGVCFFGAFAVLLPLIVQSYFPSETGGRANTQIASALGVFTLCFWVGSMLSAMVLMRIGPLRRKGRAYLGALVAGCGVLALCSLAMPFWLLSGLNFLWGMGGGVAMTLGRGLVQEYAPPDKRARVLSIFTLGLMGGAPVGAVAYGFIAHAIGPRMAILIPAIGMLAVASAVGVFSRLKDLEEPSPASA